MNRPKLDKIEYEIKETPTAEDAVKACIAWFNAEDNHLGTFDERSDLCNYSDWACRKSAGEDVGEYKGLPRIILTLGQKEDE